MYPKIIIKNLAETYVLYRRSNQAWRRKREPVLLRRHRDTEQGLPETRARGRISRFKGFSSLSSHRGRVWRVSMPPVQRKPLRPLLLLLLLLFGSRLHEEGDSGVVDAVATGQ